VLSAPVFALTRSAKLVYVALMSIMDRYLLRQFLRAFLIGYLSLTGLYVVFDLFTNLDEFLRCGQKVGGVASFVAQYYGYKTILFFDRTSGPLCLVSAMFLVALLQRHNEMTALQAAGISRVRVLRPIFFAAVALSLLAAVNRETLMPCFRYELARRPQDPLGDQPQSIQPRYDGQTDVLMTGKYSYADEQRIEEPQFLLPPLLRQYGKQITAENAYYKPPSGDRPGGYLCVGVREPRNLESRPSLLLDGRPVLITPHDAPQWLKPHECFLVSDVDFEQLAGGDSFKQFSSTAQLIRGLRNPSLSFGADVRVTIHARFVQPLLDLTLLFLGLPLVVHRESRNVFLAMGMCLILTTTYSLVVIGTQHLGAMLLLSPPLAAWLPLMIFVPPAVGMWEWLEK